MSQLPPLLSNPGNYFNNKKCSAFTKRICNAIFYLSREWWLPRLSPSRHPQKWKSHFVYNGLGCLSVKKQKNVFLKSLVVVVVDGEGKKCGTFLEHPACFLREAVWRERKIITKKKTYDTYTQMNNKVRKVLGKASGCRRSVTSAEPRALIRPTTPPAMRPCSIRRHF